jgi:hypothetical protein
MSAQRAIGSMTPALLTRMVQPAQAAGGFVGHRAIDGG